MFFVTCKNLNIWILSYLSAFVPARIGFCTESVPCNAGSITKHKSGSSDAKMAFYNAGSSPILVHLCLLRLIQRQQISYVE
jgi:hypothetical protein